MRAWVIFACAATLLGQDGGDLLARVKARVADTLAHVSQFMCTQTVERTSYELANVFDRAVACADILASKKPLRETTSDRFVRPAPRPKNSVLSGERFRALTGESLPSWKDAVHDYLGRRSARKGAAA